METTSFDAFNRPLTVKYPDNETVTYTYDREGDETLTAGSDSLVTTVWYNERGQLARLDRGNNVRTDYAYFGVADNFRLQMADTWRPGSVPASRLELNYTYDDMGNILSIFEDVSDDSQTFTYDHRDRLLTAQATGGVADYSQSYGYDKLGNLTSITKQGQFNSYAYPTGTGNPPDQPDAVQSIEVAGAREGVPTTPLYDFVYDDNGNMTTRIDHTVPITYTQGFDIQNRLINVTQSGTTTVTTFDYDDSGQRTKTAVMTPGSTLITTVYPFPNYEKVRIP